MSDDRQSISDEATEGLVGFYQYHQKKERHRAFMLLALITFLVLAGVAATIEDPSTRIGHNFRDAYPQTIGGLQDWASSRAAEYHRAH